MAASTRATFTRTTASLGLLAGFLWGGCAAAAEGGWYLAASYGSAVNGYGRNEIDGNVNDALDGRATVEASEVRKNKPVWSAGVGYWFSPNFGLEASYLNLGTLKYHSRGTGDASSDIGTFSLDFETKSRGPALALVGALPMSDRWGVDARLGAYQVKSTSDGVFVADGNPNPSNESAKTTSLLAGAGVSYIVSTHLTVRLDYLYVNRIKEQLLEKDFDMHVATAGLTYVF